MVDPGRCLGCKTCELRCAVEKGSISRTLRGAIKEEVVPLPGVFVQSVHGQALPVRCAHCAEAPCLLACPVEAMRVGGEDGAVYCDQARCIGCLMCVMVCPIGAVYPADGRRFPLKCDQCWTMERPACVAACPTGALALEEITAEAPSLVDRRRQAAGLLRTILNARGRSTSESA